MPLESPQALDFVLKNAPKITTALRNAIAFITGFVICAVLSLFVSKHWMLNNILYVFAGVVIVNVFARGTGGYIQSRKVALKHQKNVENIVKDAKRRNVVRHLD